MLVSYHKLTQTRRPVYGARCHERIGPMRVLASVVVGAAASLVVIAMAFGDPVRAPLADEPGEPGLEYLYHEGDFDSVLDLDSHEPTRVGTTSAFALPDGIARDRFGLEIYGAIEVPEDGEYTFYTVSDDGSRLYIGNTLVVHNDYPHGARERGGTIGLGAGRHPIYVAYFEGLVDEVLEVYWEGPGIEKSPIPPEVLTRYPKAVSFPLHDVSTVEIAWPELPHALKLVIDTREAPELGWMRETVPQVLRDHYPMLVSLLGVEGQPYPTSIAVRVRRDIGVPAYCSGRTVVLDVDWFTRHPGDLGCIVHEVSHLVQAYEHFDGMPGWLVEGIADYARHRAGIEDGWSIPKAYVEGTRYTNGYGVTAAFLVYLEDRYGSDLVVRLHRALKDGSYAVGLFEQLTGKDLEALWDEYKSESASAGVR